MGEESGSQRSAAAAAYDYESDPRWADYWAQAMVPPNLANHPQVVAHFKHKFYHQFVAPDLSVDGMSSNNSSQPSTSSGGPSISTSENARSPESAERPTSRTSSRRIVAGPLDLDRRAAHFIVNAWVLVIAMVGILPIVPSHLQKKGYRLSLLGTFCSSVHSLYILYGIPRISNLYAIQAWYNSVAATRDFIHLMYCLIFCSSKLKFKLALVPVLCWALERVTKFLRHNFTSSSFYRRYLEHTCAWVEANMTRLSFLSANSEILLGFLLIISLFSSRRNYAQTFMYWQLLKLTFHCPLTAPYNQAIWRKIGRTLDPHIQHYAPFLHRPLFAVMRWWFR